MKKYYEAYEERYKAIHDLGYAWASEIATPIVLETIDKCGIQKEDRILELGCGEGRDANALLNLGYDVLATDISKEAIRHCKTHNPRFAHSYKTLDCLNGPHEGKYHFIYAVALIHMLVLDEDRKRFYAFIHDHLEEDGLALICSMGDGTKEFQTDVQAAFDLQMRNHPSGEVLVPATSCRMVSFSSFRREIDDAGLCIVEDGLTSSPPEFDSLMYAIAKKRVGVPNIKDLRIKDLQPSQFYISEEKMAKIKEWFNPEDLSNFEPIPIKELDGEIVITDGHTRLVAALLSGLTKVPLVWDEDDLSWDMYRECVKECKKQNILSPNDLIGRIISGQEYETKWNRWCDIMQNRINSKAQ